MGEAGGLAVVAKANVVDMGTMISVSTTNPLHRARSNNWRLALPARGTKMEQVKACTNVQSFLTNIREGDFTTRIVTLV